MLPVVSGVEAIEAMQKGAYQSATVTVYDVTSTGHPQIISFNNTKIVMNSLTVQRSCSTYNAVELGDMISDELNFSVRDATVANYNLDGQTVAAMISWENTGRYSPDSLYVFSGLITEVKHLYGDVYHITALDPCIVFDKPYKQSELRNPSNSNQPLTYPVSSWDLVYSIIRDIGSPYINPSRPLEHATAVNKTASVSGIDETQGYTYRQVLRWCAQVMGVNLRIYHSPTPTMETWLWAGPSTTALDDAVAMKESNSFSMTVGRENQDYNGGLEIVSGDTTLYEDPNSGNRIQVADNALLNQMNTELSASDFEDLCQNASRNVRYALSSSYNSSDLRTTSMWYLEPGDIVLVERGNVGVRTPITSVTHKLNGASYIKADVSSPATAGYSATQAFSGQQRNQLSILLAKYQPTVGGFTPTNANATVAYQSVRQVGSIVYVAMAIQLPAVFGRLNVTLGTLTGVDAPGNTISVSPCVTTGNTTAYNPASVMFSGGGFMTLVCNEQNDTTVWINTCYQAPLS